MAELHDPDQPAGALIEVRDDGSALRNDGVELKPAEKNPWYVLATVYGECENLFDKRYVAKNRRIWNGWICTGASKEVREALAKSVGVAVEDLADLTESETVAIRNAFDQRLGPDVQVPTIDTFIDLSELYFENAIRLEQYIFPCMVEFSCSVFSGYATFVFSAFCRSGIFDDVEFRDQAVFHGVTFKDRAAFSSATFHSFANFGSAQFSGVEFDAAIFQQQVTFTSASFESYAVFRRTKFRLGADFSNKMFDGQTTFSDAKFFGHVPKFYQRTFHQDTEFSLDQANWPTITRDNAAESKRAYTRLRQVMNELHKPDDEHFFFRQEMRCKALLENIWNRWPFVLFRWMSDYGYSVTRPIAWLAAVVVLGGAVIGSYLRTTGIPGNGSIWQGLGVSFSNTFPFLGFTRKMHTDFFKIAPAWLDALSAAQSILGVILLFFLGLGLRNRFRIK